MTTRKPAPGFGSTRSAPIFSPTRPPTTGRKSTTTLARARCRRKRSPGPTENEARAVTDWIDQEIRNAERMARNSPGRTRRLNRTEYFNTLRDLFHLDENYVRSLDGRIAAGWEGGWLRSRRVVAVYRSSATGQISGTGRSGIERASIDAQAEGDRARQGFREGHALGPEPGRNGKLTLLSPRSVRRRSSSGPMDNRELATLPTGATIYELKNGGIEYLGGGKSSPIGSHGTGAVQRSGRAEGTGPARCTTSSRNHPGGKVSPEVSSRSFRGEGKICGREREAAVSSLGKMATAANFDRGSVVIDAPLDQPRDFVMDVYLHPRPEIAGSTGAADIGTGRRPALREIVEARPNGAHRPGA